ncbi:MAG: N-6 DNA methylase [Oscillospiraceae bacterium]|nr:N-6 DNA methylase [Oscillospiraceae bacterium]MDY4770937.1 N-6 DNA methylase [Lachnospiraceae bacterium]
MLNFDVKKKINTLRDILVGKVPDPKAQVEQITIALIYKFMDDMDLQGAEFGGARVFFSGDYKDYAFSQIMLPEHSAQDRLNLYAEGIDKMTNNPDLPKLFRDILRNAYIPYRDPETLNRFLKEIAEFSYEDSEDLGNAFEYLLSIMGSQGDAGQFRTPRHIIDMMVEITAPAKNESILDPACGTAGFLISAYNYIKKSNLDEHGKSTLVADDMTRMTKNFTGYDISPDMVRLSRVNMYLHGFTSPNISEYDTLTSLEKWDDNFDVIFSNPPFMTPKGGITPHNRYRVSAKRAEVLFVDYIAEHLNPTGRAAIIVPEGIVFQSQTAYKNLRKMLVEGNYLYGVISLPAGVFNPYSGVKTSILLIDKTLAKERDSILFVKLNNDGFDLGAQRREIKGSEIPDVVNIFKDYRKGVDIEGQENVVLAKKSDIGEQDYILVGERYVITISSSGKWPQVKIGDICTEIKAGFACGNSAKDIEGVVHIRPMNITPDGRFSLVGSKYIDRGELREEFKIRAGDVLFNNTNSKELVGKTCFVASDIYAGFSNHITRIRVGDQVMPQYIALVLQSMFENGIFLRMCNKWVGQAAINAKTLGGLSIPLPPLTVQEEIVTEIESYQKIIDGARQVVENYKPTIKIDPAWETVPLGEVCVTSSGGTPKSSNREYYENGTINWLKSGEVANGYIYATEQKITEKALQESSAKVFPPETVVVAMYGATAGQVGILKIESSTNQAVCGILPNKMFEPDFLYLYLLSKHDYFVSQSTGGAQPNISQMLIRKTLVPIVPIDEQKRIVSEISIEMSIVEQNKRLIEIFQQKIKDKIAEVWGA